MTVPGAARPRLAMRQISKSFAGAPALSDVSLQLGAGEVLALMGENGAGKSTLMKVLGGVLAPDAGAIEIDGEPAHIRSVADAKRHGVALIHQELLLAPNLDIAANLFLGSELPKRGRWLWPVPRERQHETAQLLLQRVGLALPASTPVSRLSVGQMQLCEIAKALGQSARILVMDEPTSSLAAGESEHLFEIIRLLEADGVGIIYISHRLDEVLALAHRVCVLRDGRNAGELRRDEITHERVVELMVGRQLSGRYFPVRSRATPPVGRPLLEVRELRVPGAPPVSFEAHRGEIVGFAGLVGSGRTELMEAIFGIRPALAGELRLDGQPLRVHRPREAIEAGIYLAPEDRKSHGFVPELSISANLSLPGIGRGAPLGWLDRRRERATAERETARLSIKARSASQRVVELSGGNQQKVVLGKWLALGPRVLILDEPTRGIDVGAKAEIYQLMAGLAEAGVTILMVSSDLEEILGMSDRVVVMHERRVAGVLAHHELEARRLAGLMTGQRDDEAAA